MKFISFRSALRFSLLMITSFTITALAQAEGEVSSSVITDELTDHFTAIWGVAQWVMQAILVITAGVVAFKTATKGQGEDRTGGWIAVISILLVAIGLTFVPTIAETLFGINF